jgi:uncharacterized protein DUF4159
MVSALHTPCEHGGYLPAHPGAAGSRAKPPLGVAIAMLRARTRGDRARLAVCLGVSAALHLIMLLANHVSMPTPSASPLAPKPRFSRQELRVRRPLVRDKPPELGRVPHPRARPDKRPLARPTEGTQGVARAPSAVGPVGFTAAELHWGDISVPRARASIDDLSLALHVSRQRTGPPMGRAEVGGQRRGESEVDLASELLGVEALNTGKSRAVVVVDPRNRRNLKGHLHLAGVHSEGMERGEQQGGDCTMWTARRLGCGEEWISRRAAEAQTLAGLARLMQDETQVRAELVDWLHLDDARLLEIPFLLLTVQAPFEVTTEEVKNLGRYLTGGGFVYAEVVAYPRPVENGFVIDVPALRQLMESSLSSQGLTQGRDWEYVRLDEDHEIFHSFFDVGSVPAGFWDMSAYGDKGSGRYGGTDYWQSNEFSWSAPYLEGIQVHGQMVGIYSQKNFSDYWALSTMANEDRRGVAHFLSRAQLGRGDEIRVGQLGVNILVYALTREGSVAQQLVSVE